MLEAFAPGNREQLPPAASEASRAQTCKIGTPVVRDPDVVAQVAAECRVHRGGIDRVDGRAGAVPLRLQRARAGCADALPGRRSRGAVRGPEDHAVAVPDPDESESDWATAIALMGDPALGLIDAHCGPDVGVLARFVSFVRHSCSPPDVRPRNGSVGVSGPKSLPTAASPCARMASSRRKAPVGRARRWASPPPQRPSPTRHDFRTPRPTAAPAYSPSVIRGPVQPRRRWSASASDSSVAERSATRRSTDPSHSPTASSTSSGDEATATWRSSSSRSGSAEVSRARKDSMPSSTHTRMISTALRPSTVTIHREVRQGVGPGCSGATSSGTRQPTSLTLTPGGQAPPDRYASSSPAPGPSPVQRQPDQYAKHLPVLVWLVLFHRQPQRPKLVHEGRLPARSLLDGGD